MAKRYVSYSEMTTFYEDKDKYYQQYIIGVREAPNKAMMFGSIVHALLEDKEYDYKKAIKEAGFTSDFKRIADKVSKETPRSEESELKLFVDFDDFALYAGIDGRIGEDLVEYKTGKAMWTQERADESEQITLYSLAWQLKYGKLPNYLLITISSTNGKFRQIRTSRTEAQLENMKAKLRQFKKDLEELDWWSKKCPSADRITL